MERGQRFAVYALTPAGARLGASLAEELGADLFLPERFAAERPGAGGFAALGPLVAENFRKYGGHVFIAAAGVVVRLIAPLLRDKTADPAVVVLDQAGRFCVSLLSGHLGGANDLARRVAALTGGQAVITTATDAAGLPSLDVLARDLGLVIENVENVKWANGTLLAGRPLAVHDPDGLLAGPSCGPSGSARPGGPSGPDGTVEPSGASRDRAGPLAQTLSDLGAVTIPAPSPEADVVVDWRAVPVGPRTLVLRPRRLVAGIGCRRGVPADEIEGFVRETFAAQGWALGSLAAVGTIEKKRDEAGLLEAVARLGAELVFFEALRLRGVVVPTPSLKPLEHVGTASVAEASAMLLCDGRLIMTKRKTAGVTLAVGLKSWPRG